MTSNGKAFPRKLDAKGPARPALWPTDELGNTDVYRTAMSSAGKQELVQKK